MPYADRGQLKNAQRVYKREPTPVEKQAQKVIDSPVRPTIINGSPGVQYQKSTPYAPASVKKGAPPSRMTRWSKNVGRCLVPVRHKGLRSHGTAGLRDPSSVCKCVPAEHDLDVLSHPGNRVSTASVCG